jgi:cytoskeletal protein CcmA (bactofilin family)
MRRSVLLLSSLFPLLSLSYAARLESGSSFTLLREEAQVGDLYFGGSALRIDGRVEGSVIAGCQSAAVGGFVTRNVFVGCQTLDMSGAVQGDLVALCAGMHLGGPVAGAVRAAAGTVSVDSRIGQDLVVGCRDLTIGRDAEVGGDVIVGCATLNINGAVHGDVRAAAGEIIVSGVIDGDLIASVGTRLVLTKDARVFGSVIYKSDFELDIGNRDAVFGEIRYTRRLSRPTRLEEIKHFRPRPGVVTAFFLPFALFSVLAALLIGFILVAIWKHAVRQALDNCIGRFGRTVGFGALGLLAAPAALVLSIVLVITIPAGLVGLLLYLVFLYLSKIFAGMFLGRWLFRICGGASASPWLFAPVGIILAYALCTIPIAGWLLWLFAAIIGFGVIIELLAATRRT